MKTRQLLRTALLLVAFTLLTSRLTGQVTSFSDVQYWTGSGTNESVMILNWNDSLAPQSLAWGYRWNGTASAADMLTAIVVADTRLYSRMETTGFGLTLYGLGYDRDNDGTFGISDGTVFDSNGIANTTFGDGPPGFTAPTATDLSDHYKEGWWTGFWGFFNGVGNPMSGGSWTVAGVGLSDHTLTSGNWESLGFDQDFSFDGADAPTVATAAAVPEPRTTVLTGLAAALLCLRKMRGRAKAVREGGL
ncbi:MAG: hypothetical protein SFY92_03680 [Verrucomicrobiae bacterium]|nr:hypothetical protein [Verrucomicrobiae bacterium]